MESKYIALVPAYQPAGFLLELVKELAAGFLVVLVDDGSESACQELFAGCERYATVLRHKVNAGKGRALKTGLAYIQERYGQKDIVVTVDADGQHRVEDAFELCRRAEKNPNALVLGSRKLKENVPLRSLFGNTVTRFVYRLAAGRKVHDTQTGLRAFQIKAARTSLCYLVISLFCALFGGVYELFSHQVYSYFMIYAFIFPLAGGTLPFLLLCLTKKKKYPPALPRNLYHSGIAALTVGSVLRGILDIYGTTNSLTNYYWIAGILFLAAAFGTAGLKGLSCK